MARIFTPREKYITEIENLLKTGLSIEQITANKLQTTIGWKYSKISEILEEYKAEYTEKIKKQNETPKSAWYQDIASNITKSITSNLNDSWIIINDEIAKSVNQVTQDFKIQKSLLEIQKKEDSKQIENLETEIDELKNQLKENEIKLEETNKTNSVLKSNLHRVDSEIKQLRIENGNLIEEVWTIKGKLQVKDEIIEKLENKK